MTISTYNEEWKRMNRIYRRLLISFLVGPIGLALNHYFIDPADRATPGLTLFCIAWMSFGAWTAYQYQTMPCPRCGQLWGGSWFSLSRMGPWNMLFLRHRCANCELELPQ